MTDPRPVYSRVEFDGDCFGKLYNPKAAECGQCLVARRCAGGAEVKDVSVNSFEDDMKKKKKGNKKEDKKSVKIDKNVEVLKARPPSKTFLKDKENCGTRPGTAHWAVFKVLDQVFDKGEKFTTEDLASKVTVACKEGKIKFDADAKLPRSLPYYVKHGVIGRTNKRGIFVKLVK